MMARRLGLAVPLLVLLSACDALTAAELTVKHIKRQISLETSLAKVEERYAFGSKPDTAVVCMPGHHSDQAVSLVFKAPGSNEALPDNEADSQSTKPGVDAACFAVKMGSKSSELVVEYVLAHSQIPDPPTMRQDGRQMVTFSGTIHALSPYTVASQKLTVQLPSHDLAESSNLDKGKGTKNVAGRKVTYTELKDTAPFEAAPLWLRYRNHHPFVHFLSVDREITVSHWGRVYVEERYRLRNSGTKVMPPYSRWNITEEAMSGQAAGSPHLRVLPMSLPKTAQYIYTKDDLGHTQERALALLMRGW